MRVWGGGELPAWLLRGWEGGGPRQAEHPASRGSTDYGLGMAPPISTTLEAALSMQDQLHDGQGGGGTARIPVATTSCCAGHIRLEASERLRGRQVGAWH